MEVLLNSFMPNSHLPFLGKDNGSTLYSKKNNNLKSVELGKVFQNSHRATHTYLESYIQRILLVIFANIGAFL